MSGGTALTAARAVLGRDLLRAWRRRGEIVQPLVFFTRIFSVLACASTGSSLSRPLWTAAMPMLESLE